MTVHGTFQTHTVSECLTTSANPNSCPKLDSVAEEKPDSPLSSERAGLPLAAAVFVFRKPFGHSVTFGA